MTGAKWTYRAEPLPKRSSAGVLWGVSCVSAAYCVLAGDFNRNLHDSPLFEWWNGRTFTAMLGVSCGSPSSCLAVGAATEGQVYDAQGMSYDGRSWTVTSVPGTPVSGAALIGSWNGKSWRLVTVS